MTPALASIVLAVTLAQAPAPAPDLGPALVLQDAFAAVADKVAPSIVCISGYARVTEPDADGDAGGGWAVRDAADDPYPGYRKVRSGTGLIVSADGDIICCRHTLRAGDDTLVDFVDVELHNRRRLLARVVGTEPTINLGVLRIEETTATFEPDLAPIVAAPPRDAHVGHWAIAIGDPDGPERTFAVGILAGTPIRQCYQGEVATTYLQASLTVHPEAYGGALVNIHGQVMGMLMPADPDADDVGAGRTPGSEFAFPMDVAMNIAGAVKAKETHRSPWLGVSVLAISALRARFETATDYARMTRPEAGVYIDDVYDPSPATKADIRTGDFITAIGGAPVKTVLDFQKWLYLAGIDRTVTVEIFRDGKTLTKTATIAMRPAEARIR